MEISIYAREVLFGAPVGVILYILFYSYESGANAVLVQIYI